MKQTPDLTMDYAGWWRRKEAGWLCGGFIAGNWKLPPGISIALQFSKKPLNESVKVWIHRSHYGIRGWSYQRHMCCGTILCSLERWIEKHFPTKKAGVTSFYVRVVYDE